MKKLIFCFDIDNTLCVSQGRNYKKSKPIKKKKNKYIQKKDKGNTWIKKKKKKTSEKGTIDLSDAKELDLDYLYDNRSYVLGSMFGGHKNSVPKICDMVEDIFLNEMIKKGNVNNEQIALGYLIKKYPDEFATYERTNGKHMALFEELA